MRQVNAQGIRNLWCRLMVGGLAKRFRCNMGVFVIWNRLRKDARRACLIDFAKSEPTSNRSIKKFVETR